MSREPNDSIDCPTCLGTGRVDCDVVCAECKHNDDCKNKLEKTKDCSICEGLGLISESAAKQLKFEARMDYLADRGREDRDDR